MEYISTRGGTVATASEALVRGIAPDGGLFIPKQLPVINSSSWTSDFATTYRTVLDAFFGGLPEAALSDAVERMTTRFGAVKPTPLKNAGGVYFLELFHGPTRAFKDVALTALPVLLNAAARQQGIEKIAILTATSGDTGSAALNGFADVAGTEMLVFYPKTGISEIQRRQMVCQAGENVRTCAIDGNFDDAQNAVKAIFNDPDIRARAEAKQVSLSSANSINIGRLFPQMSYYIDAWRQLRDSGVLPDDSAVFDITVPTGNFGNILAAYYAKRMGIPIRRLVVASNRNNTVSEFIRNGTYDRRRDFSITNSPSMDILISSNTERILYDLTNHSPERLTELMNDLATQGYFKLSDVEHARLREDFSAAAVSPENTEKAIHQLWEDFGYLADPHTAVGWTVAREYCDDGIPMIVAATASPWKFPTTMVHALEGVAMDNDFSAIRRLSEFTRLAPDLLSLENAAILHGSACQREDAAEMCCKTFNI